MIVDINTALNEILVKLFRNIAVIEERSLRKGEYKNVTVNDMHVMEAIGIGEPKNMTAVAKVLAVTTGTLTISVNSLVKKGLVERVRSEEDRRVVLVSLSESGKQAYEYHQKFHKEMVDTILRDLNDKEKEVLAKALNGISNYFRQCLENE